MIDRIEKFEFSLTLHKTFLGKRELLSIEIANSEVEENKSHGARMIEDFFINIDDIGIAISGFTEVLQLEEDISFNLNDGDVMFDHISFSEAEFGFQNFEFRNDVQSLFILLAEVVGENKGDVNFDEDFFEVGERENLSEVGVDINVFIYVLNHSLRAGANFLDVLKLLFEVGIRRDVFGEN